MKFQILSIFFVILLISFGSNAFVNGVGCPPTPYEERWEEVPLIFYGKLISKEYTNESQGKLEVTFQITEVFKGNHTNQVTLATFEEDQWGIDFEKDSNYAVYAEYFSDVLSVDPLCGGSHKIVEDTPDPLRWAAQSLGYSSWSPLDEITDVQAAPPSPDSYEKHREKVDSIISMEEKPSPKEQRKIGILYHTVMCNNDFVLLLKWTSNKSACVSFQTAEKLIERNWGVYAKDVSVVNFGDDPRELPFRGGPTSISFEYDVSKYDEVKLYKKIREKFSEHFKELGWSGDYVWAYMFLDKKSEGYFTLDITGGIREDLLRGALEKVEGVSNIENYTETFA